MDEGALLISPLRSTFAPTPASWLLRKPQRDARVVATDINEYRLQKAKEFGADEVIHGAQDLNLKAERVIVCTGAYAAVEQAFRCIDKKGIILLFAIPNRDIAIPIPDFWRNELTVSSSYGAAPVDLEAALALIADKKINITDTITRSCPCNRFKPPSRLWPRPRNP